MHRFRMVGASQRVLNAPYLLSYVSMSVDSCAIFDWEDLAPHISVCMNTGVLFAHVRVNMIHMTIGRFL